ncbi:hypothetical protein ACQKIE_16095 [Luteibacter sp. NPDC031894]|uniref:hypothetical protein n=1 Tax=Luteibacter sp. NPDC031894 TaxID=3390572 RepID=UPI003CFC6266
MCFGSGTPSAPKTAAITPVVQPSQAISDQSNIDSANERRRLQASTGQQSTIVTGGSGAGLPTSSSKTLIGG